MPCQSDYDPPSPMDEARAVRHFDGKRFLIGVTGWVKGRESDIERLHQKVSKLEEKLKAMTKERDELKAAMKTITGITGGKP